MIIQASEVKARVWDLCVVGTGPVGMALALEFERLGFDVLVLEAGGKERKPAATEATRAEIVDERRHASMELAVCRVLGGSSWTWGGRCVPYDDVDWLDRSFVSESHWPVTHDDVRPWYKNAAEHLLCGSDEFCYAYSRPFTGGLDLTSVERWSSESQLIQIHRDHLVASEQIHVSLDSTVTGITLSADGKLVDSLTVQTATGTVEVAAGRVILAMGGVETTRLLLHVQRRNPSHFGGIDGPLGRYYMGHISGKIASIRFDRPEEFRDLDFKLDSNGTYYRRRFMLSADCQLANQVLNTAFWPDNPPFYDPRHRSGVLSAVFLALAFPPTGRKLLSEAIRLAHTGPKPYPLGAHLRNAILGAPRGAVDIYRILRDRFIRKPKKPGFLVSNRGGEYALHYHAEQVPNAESRITLSDEVDAHGVPRARIDLRFTAQDVESVLTSHRLLDAALRENGIGRLSFWDNDEKLRDLIWKQASDGFHQVGTIRMGEDASSSVVDSHLRVHGLQNLFVASSAVFPSSGQANSTLLAAAFAMRLAHELAGKTPG